VRIVHIVAHMAKNGVATSCASLIRAQVKCGHDIMLVTMPDGWLASQDFPDGVTMVGSHLKTRPAELRRIGQCIRNWQPTIIHCHGSKANKYGLVFRVVAGAPVIATAHARKFQLPWAWMRAVIAPSEQTANYHRRRNLVPSGKIAVIPHLYAPAQSDVQSRVAMREEFGFGDDNFVIGMVGTICTRKNQLAGLKLLKALSLDYRHARLVIVGDSDVSAGDEPMPGWNDQLRDPVIASRTVITGHRDDAGELMNGFDTLLSASHIEEGPIVVLEAMARGVPVLTSATGMVPHLVRDGIDGFVFASTVSESALNSLRMLVNDPVLRQRIGKQGRARLQDVLDERDILNRIDAVYERVARKAGTWRHA